MKNKIKKHFLIFLAALLPISFTLQSCEEGGGDIISLLDQLFKIVSETGWLAEKENLDDIPSDIVPFDDDTSNLKSLVDLSDKFPPVGDQGQYGTCVVWAVGYNLKTALNGIEKGWNTLSLSTSANQTSPKALWLNIPSDSKGDRCGGTNFEPAMDALISDGAASMNTVPYQVAGTTPCTGDKKGDSSNKLSNYRKIAYNENGKSDGMTLDNFKGYLNAGRPIAFGARLGDLFMTWKNSSVIKDDTYNNPGMEHAYHAMVLIGYNDSKNAFRVRNSWGTTWGENGDIWVDYNFFLTKFCFAAFVAQNVNSISASGGTITGNLSSGYDLLAYSAVDKISEEHNNDPKWRDMVYQVYNSGDETIYPSQKWSVVYMYYNATDGNDYQIIFEDYYTDEFGEGDDEYDPDYTLSGGWWNNAKVEPGKIIGFEEYGADGFKITYPMPDITGKYYLVLIADAFDKISEVNEDNNFYFITAASGKPLEFKNGVMQSTPVYSTAKSARSKQFGNTETQSVVSMGNPNAYTPAELRGMLLHDKKTGKLDEKISKFRGARAKNSTVILKKPVK